MNAATGLLLSSSAPRDWLEVLTLAIDTHRGGMPSIYVESAALALMVAHVLTKPRHDDEAPTLLSAVQEMGELVRLGAGDKLGTYTRADELTGQHLLGAALLSGFAELKADAPIRNRRGQQRVYLTLAAEADLDRIAERLANAELTAERPLLECPALDITPTPNRDDIDPPPYATDPFMVAAGLKPIQDTAFRVNQYMLDVLKRLKLDKPSKQALKIARKYANAPRFWYRCGFDWRGRISQHGGRLQYTSGCDAARGLLEFADGEALTGDGYGWLATHVATCYGHRGSYTDRAVWTHGREHDIRAAVADPIGFQQWWGVADQPFSFLAACHAWVHRDERIYLPVSADATASGFQHYALLLRDETLGRMLNLEPAGIGARPHDFYAELGANWVWQDGRQLTRSDVKPVAWMIYGKTPRDDQERRLMAALQSEPVLEPLWRLYEALRAVAAFETGHGRALEWTTPDGFRVRQANREADSSKTAIWVPVAERAPLKRLQMRRRVLRTGLSRQDQQNGFPPNLIHSLDACLLRAIVREAQTVTAWAVAHDCLGVHPNRGGELRQAVQRAVAWLYGPDRLSMLPGISGSDSLPASMRGGWYTFS